MDFAALPWSPRARSELDGGEAAIRALAGSVAMSRLARTIERYCDGRLPGHAVLVSGHRGAGKTTAVLAAMQHVHNRCRNDGRSYRPLLVVLHGPGLLTEDPPSGQSAAAFAAAAPPAGAGPNEAADAVRISNERRALRCLEEMAAGILPAIVDELRLLLAEAEVQAAAPGPDDLRASVRAERVARLADELPRGMPVAALREQYRRLGLLPDGLLRRGHGAFDELAAIVAAVEVSEIVTGKVSEARGHAAKTDEASVRESSLAVAGNSLTRALTPIVAAGAAAFGFAQDHILPSLVLAGVILAGGFGLSRSRKETRSREATRSRGFVRDTTLASVKRWLPALVARLRAVGMPPVFVIDELDKVADPADLIDGLLSNLKSIVTERSLFFFITGHDYYADNVAAKASMTPYPSAHTYFGERAYVLSTVADLHGYLKGLLVSAGDPTIAPDRELSIAKRQDHVLYRLLLLLRSRMHIYDLRAEWARAWHNGELPRLVSQNPSRIHRPVVSYEFFFQMCIEWVLADSTQRRHSADDPYYGQLLRTELYLVVDLWREGQPLRTIQEELERVGVATKNAEQADLVVRALDDFCGFLVAPDSLRVAIDAELDQSRLEEFITRSDDVDDKELEREKASLSAAELKGRPSALVAAVNVSDRLALLKQIKIRAVLGPNDYRPTVTLPELTRDVDSKIAGLVSLVRELAGNEAVQEIGFSVLWRAALPGRDEPRFDPNDGRLLDHVDEDIAASALVIVQAFHDFVVGVSVVELLRDGGTYTTTPLEALEHGVEELTDVESRRNEVASIVRGVVEANGVGLPEGVLQLLRCGSKQVQKGNGAKPSDIVQLEAGFKTQPVLLDRWQSAWQLSIAVRVVAQFDSEQTFTPGVDDGALDLMARARGWFTVGSLDTWWRLFVANQWPIVVWAALYRSGVQEFCAIACAVLNQGLNLREALEPLNGRSDARSLQLVDWLVSQLRRLKGQDLTNIYLLQPQVELANWLPSHQYTLKVEGLDYQPGRQNHPVLADAYLVFVEASSIDGIEFDPTRYIVVGPSGIEPQPPGNDELLHIQDPGGVDQAVQLAVRAHRGRRTAR